MSMGDANENCSFTVSYQRPTLYKKLGKEELEKNTVGRRKSNEFVFSVISGNGQDLATERASG